MNGTEITTEDTHIFPVAGTAVRVRIRESRLRSASSGARRGRHRSSGELRGIGSAGDAAAGSIARSRRGA